MPAIVTHSTSATVSASHIRARNFALGIYLSHDMCSQTMLGPSTEASGWMDVDKITGKSPNWINLYERLYRIKLRWQKWLIWFNLWASESIWVFRRVAKAQDRVILVSAVACVSYWLPANTASGIIVVWEGIGWDWAPETYTLWWIRREIKDIVNGLVQSWLNLAWAVLITRILLNLNYFLLKIN